MCPSIEKTLAFIISIISHVSNIINNNRNEDDSVALSFYRVMLRSQL